MQPRTSIYHKLILYIFLLGIFVIVAVSLFSFITSRNAILQRTFDQLTSVRVDRKTQVERFFNDRMKEIELFSYQLSSASENMKANMVDNRRSFSVHSLGLDANFERFFKSGSYYTAIYVSRGGKLIGYNLDSDSLKPPLPDPAQDSVCMLIASRARAAKHLIIKEYPAIQNKSARQLYLAAPVFKVQNQVDGIVIFALRPSAINLIMKNNEQFNGLGKSGEVYLVGPDSVMRSESRFLPVAAPYAKVQTASVRNAFKNGEGTHIIKDYRGVLTLSSFSKVHIPGLNWVIIAEMDKKEAMRPVYNLANEIVFLSIFITLILFGVAYIISRAIARPIIDLKNATIEVRNGVLDQELTIRSNDELGELTETFNQMTQQLKLQQKELKERETRVISSFLDGQEDERQRLSRELHDGLGQLIIATKLKTESMVNSGSAIDTNNLSKLRSMFDNLVDEVRNISNNLMPPALQEFGLEIALKQVCNEISGHSRIKVIFDSRIPEGEIEKRIAVYIFRIAQEALNNAVKHAGATEIIVTLIGNDKMISLTVQDNGSGFNPDDKARKNSRGLSSMRERVKLLNGLIDISGVENFGTIVSVKIPLTIETR